MQKRALSILRWLAVLPASFCFATLLYVLVENICGLILGQISGQTVASAMRNKAVVCFANISSSYFAAILGYLIAPSHKLKAAQGLLLLALISTIANYRLSQADGIDVLSGLALILLISNILNPAKVVNLLGNWFPKSNSRFSLKVILAEVLITFAGLFVSLYKFTPEVAQIAIPILCGWLCISPLLTLIFWSKLTTRFKIGALFVSGLSLFQIFELAVDHT